MTSDLDKLATRYRGNGAPLKELLRDDRQWVVCFSCPFKHGRNVRHPLRGNNADHDYADFACRHPAADGHVVVRVGPQQMERMVRRAEARKRARRESMLSLVDNASVLEAFQASDQSIDLTSFNSLASSATAGWSSHYIDNTTNLYLDYLLQAKIASVATAPTSDKAFYYFGATGLNTTDLPTSGAASGNVVPNSSTTSAALTFPSISTLPNLFAQIWVQPYPVTTVTNITPLFSFARGFGGWPGLFNWIPMVNFSGMTIPATGNTFKYRGVYNTVA